MATPNRHLVTLLFNKLIKPKFDWIKGIFVEDFKIDIEKQQFNPLTGKWSYVPKVKMYLKIYVNRELPEINDTVEDIMKVFGEKEINDLVSLIFSPKLYRYIGLNNLSESSFDGLNVDFEFIPEKIKMSELEERIVNVFKMKKPITTLGMF